MSHEIKPGWSHGANRIVPDLLDERYRQLKKWGPQSHPDGTGTAYGRHAALARQTCDSRFKNGVGTWADILLEEVYEALAESERKPLRDELVQVCAVALAWIQDLDERAGDRAAVAREPELVGAAA